MHAIVYENTFDRGMIEKDTFAKTVGARIAEHRKQQGISQSELGDIVGQSQQMITDYETGRRRIPAYNLARIAEALGVTAATLLDGSNPPRQRRGPPSKVDRLAEQISRLPRSRRRFVVEMIENALGSR